MSKPKPGADAGGLEVVGETLPAPRRPGLLLRALVASTMTGIGMIAFLYLVNPTGGIIELLPDNIPLWGNLDEAGATAILLTVLSYWGFDVTRVGQLMGGWSKGRKALPPPPAREPGRGEA